MRTDQESQRLATHLAGVATSQQHAVGVARAAVSHAGTIIVIMLAIVVHADRIVGGSVEGASVPVARI